MGKWMYLAPADNPDHELADLAPGCLMDAGDLVREHRDSFPMLWRARVQSKAYVDGRQLLGPAEASALLDEIRRLRQVCAGEGWLEGVDPQKFYDAWRMSAVRWSPQGWAPVRMPPAEFEGWLDAIEAFLERTVLENLVVVLVL